MQSSLLRGFNNYDRPGESGVRCVSDPEQAEAHDAARQLIALPRREIRLFCEKLCECFGEKGREKKPTKNQRT